MATPVIMPKFGMAQEEGTILRWHKAEGDHVHKGDVILEVMTDKVDMEAEALRDGILAGVRYGPDTTLPVTTVLCLPAGAGRGAACGRGHAGRRHRAAGGWRPPRHLRAKGSKPARGATVAADAAWTCARSRAAGRAAAYPARADVEAVLAGRFPGGDGHAADGAGDAARAAARGRRGFGGRRALVPKRGAGGRCADVCGCGRFGAHGNV
ncbi:MAG: lipoyl domain-containing protein [Caldilineaceae bacterium]